MFETSNIWISETQVANSRLLFPFLHPDTYQNLRQNIIAGIVVATIALPLSIALAVAVGVPPIAGLYTAIFAGAFAALFGGSNYNVTGPTAALVPLLNQAVLSHGARVLPLLAFMAGIFLIVLSLLRAGRLVRYIPWTVVAGFTAGIALSIAAGQLNNFFGVTGTDPELESMPARTLDSLRNFGTVGLVTPALALLTLALLIAWPKVHGLRAIPAPLVAVLIGCAGTAWFGLDVATVGGEYGDLPRSLPTPTLGFIDIGLILDVMPLALSVAVLAAVESLLSAVVADDMAQAQTRHDSDGELRGQGIGNLAAAILGGIPATAAIARTAAGIRHGTTTRMSAVAHSVVVLAATLLLGGLVGNIPMATLAAILGMVAWNIAGVPELIRLTSRASRADAAVVLGTAGITFWFDLTYAIAFGTILSMAVVLHRQVRVPAARELRPDTNGHIRDVSQELSDMIITRPDVAVFSAEGVLSFHTVQVFEQDLLLANDHRPLVLRLKDVVHIDASGLVALEGMLEHHARAGRPVYLTAPNPEVYAALERFGIIDKLGLGRVFAHTRDALAAIEEDAKRAAAPLADAVA